LDIDEFNVYNDALYEFNNELFSNTNFLEIPENDRQEVLVQYFLVNDALQRFNNCDESLMACQNLAQAIHTGAIVGCTATAAGIALGSFGVGGVIFQAFCLGANWDIYTAQLGVCTADYNNCTP
jgi:hypothetical protein